MRVRGLQAGGDGPDEPARRALDLQERLLDRRAWVQVRSPGRVNLIGDHTDYNDGLAMPMAIDRDLVMAVAPRNDGHIRLVSELDDVVHDVDAASIDGDDRWPSWTVYVQGVLRQVPGDWRTGFDAAIASDVPSGAGLSTSAALELAVARAATELAGEQWDARRAAAWGVVAENDWVGVATGVLDQLSVACGVAGHALVLDCRDHAIEAVQLPPDVEVLVLDTGARRELVDSEYTARRRDCERAAEVMGVGSLRDLDPDVDPDREDGWWQGLAGWDALGPQLQARVRHVLSENARVRRVAAALATGDVEVAGGMWQDSHASLRDDYDVSGPELDTMARLANAAPGIVGARMTGGGFAGAVVALARKDAVDTDRLLEQYRAHHDLAADAMVVNGACGTSIVPATASPA